MTVDSTIFIIPAILLCIGLEYAYALKKKKELFKFDNSVANISIGIAERLCDLFLAASFYSLFDYLYHHFALFHIPEKWYVWIILLLFTDLVWYWYHRLGHEINIFWGAHIVHHQSEDFNYTVAARITIIQSLVRNIFWCILPLVGFHADMVIAILIFHGGYSFFTHTQTIGKLGFLEHILITPSHHRVHHASNEKYIDKNYGDVFVFWDKLFGTFQKEEEKPVYGLTQPLDSYSFLWQHFHFYIEMLVAIQKAKGIRNKFAIIFGKPDVIDAEIRTALEKKFLKNQSRSSTKYRFRGYLNVQIASCLLILFWLILFYEQAGTASKVGVVIFILLTLINCGAMLEKRRWIHYLEAIRLMWIMICFSYYVQSVELFIILTEVFLISIIIFPVKRWYHQIMFSNS